MTRSWPVKDQTIGKGNSGCKTYSVIVDNYQPVPRAGL